MIANKKLDWSLAVTYNAMLRAGRALIFDRGYRPSSVEGHVAVVKFLRATSGSKRQDDNGNEWDAKEEA